MAKYEIMLILDPKEDLKVAQNLTKEVFKKETSKFEKLEKTDLAYEINNSKTGQFVLIEVEATGSEVKEFIRKSNINKSIWRHLVVNLDSESNMETLKNMKPFEPRAPREFRDRESREPREPREYKKSESSHKEAK